jgi:hypothetical protein
MHSDEAHRRAEALFRKAQHVRKGEQGMAEYQAKLDAMREKPARLRALRLARDATTKNTLPAASTNLKGFSDLLSSPTTGEGGNHGCEGDFGKEVCCEAERRGTRTA